MRQPRLKAPDHLDAACYHCISRVVNRSFVLGPEEKEMFVHFMRLYERLCGVRIITFCVMSNHFHLLAEVPKRPAVMPTEAELLAIIAKAQGKVRAHLVRTQIEQLREAGACLHIVRPFIRFRLPLPPPRPSSPPCDSPDSKPQTTSMPPTTTASRGS